MLSLQERTGSQLRGTRAAQTLETEDGESEDVPLLPGASCTPAQVMRMVFLSHEAFWSIDWLPVTLVASMVE